MHFLKLCDACGLLVNERTVYCSRYAQIPIQLACVVQPCEVNIGDRIKFQAMFSIFLNGYVVNAYRKVYSAPSIPYKLSNAGLRALVSCFFHFYTTIIFSLSVTYGHIFA